MIVLLTVVMENFLEFRRSQLRAGRPPPGRLGSRLPWDEAVVARMGGRLLVVDWDAQRVLAEHPLPSPGGLCWPHPAGPLWVGSVTEDRVVQLALEPGGPRLARLEHPAFNDLHSLHADGDGVLLTSTGVDAVLRLDSQGALSWSWWAADHGHTTGADGAPVAVDPQAPHRGRRVPTLRRALHLNGALREGGRVLVTAFHPGVIAEIAPQTGAWRVLRAGLDHPHGLARVAPEQAAAWGLPAEPHWLVGDTGRGALRVLGGPTWEDRRVLGGLRWIQDLALGPGGRVLVVDDLHVLRRDGDNRLLELDPRSGAVLAAMAWPPDWRLFGVYPLDAARADRVRRSLDAP